MKRSRFFAVLICSMLVFSVVLVGCGAPASPPSIPPSLPTPATEEKPAVEPTPTLTPTPEPTPPPQVTPYDGPLIDAHSQVEQYADLEKVVSLMDQAGVAVTILSSRGPVAPEELISYASNYPGRIVPAVKVKGTVYNENDEIYYERLRKQVNMPQFGAMAEVPMYHAEKRRLETRLVVVYPDDERVQAALDYALDKKWPFMVHIEFVAAGSLRDEFMTKLEALLVQYPEHPFVLMHMGNGLNPGDVRQLIEAHSNIYFATSHTNRIYVSIPDFLPWTNMFDGNRLSAHWKQLMIEHPGRFILAFDNVWPEDWGGRYLDQIPLWREAMGELPVEVAHALAHGNAERLWRLPPVE